MADPRPCARRDDAPPRRRGGVGAGARALAGIVAGLALLGGGRGREAAGGDERDPRAWLEVFVAGPTGRELDAVTVEVDRLPLRALRRGWFRADLGILGRGRPERARVVTASHPAYESTSEPLDLPYRLDGTLPPGLRVALVLTLDRARPSPGDREVSGRVVDAQGAPVAGASVAVLGARARSVATAPDGGYTLRLPGDARHVRVVATTPDRGTSDVVAVALDAPAVTVPSLVLDAGLAISGALVPALADAGAEILATPIVPGAADAPPGPAVLLDPATRLRARLVTPVGRDGRFRLGGATPGLWRVSRTGPQRLAGTVHPDLADAFERVVRVPGPPVSLGARARYLTVAVRADDRPLPGAIVTVSALRGRLVLRADDAGRAGAWVPADGLFTITASSFGAEPRAVRVGPGDGDLIEVGLRAADLAELELPPAPPTGPLLRIVGDDGLPVAAELRLLDDAGRGLPSTFAEVLSPTAWVEYDGRSSARGPVTVTSPLPPTPLRLEVTGPDLEPRRLEVRFDEIPTFVRVRHRRADAAAPR